MALLRNLPWLDERVEENTNKKKKLQGERGQEERKSFVKCRVRRRYITYTSLHFSLFFLQLILSRFLFVQYIYFNQYTHIKWAHYTSYLFIIRYYSHFLVAQDLIVPRISWENEIRRSYISNGLDFVIFSRVYSSFGYISYGGKEGKR